MKTYNEMDKCGQMVLDATHDRFISITGKIPSASDTTVTSDNARVIGIHVAVAGANAYVYVSREQARVIAERLIALSGGISPSEPS